MIDRRQRRLDSVDSLDRGGRRARYHHHLDTEQAGCLDLCIGGGTATVLGDDGVDVVLPQQIAFTVQRERTPIEDIVDIIKHKRWFDGIHAANEVVMLRCGFRMMGTLPARRQEDMARGGAERFDGSRNAPHVPPAIAGHALPFGTAQSDRGNAGGFGRKSGVGRNALGEGVRGVDQQVISAGLEEIGKCGSAAETTDTNRNRLRGRFFGAAGKRQQNIAIITRRQRLGQQPRLAGAAKDQDAGSSHV